MYVSRVNALLVYSWGHHLRLCGLFSGDRVVVLLREANGLDPIHGCMLCRISYNLLLP